MYTFFSKMAKITQSKTTVITIVTNVLQNLTNSLTGTGKLNRRSVYVKKNKTRLEV